jgi:DNA-binding winged helix-turn-helix (wHTH) protein/Tol biopolymer transport system component
MSVGERQEKELIIHFGEFTLDCVRRGLYKGRDRVRLTSKPLETLIFLVEHRGIVVEKQQLLDAVWKDTFVTEDTLVHAVRQVRRALEDDKGDPRFVQTVPRQGYRFVGEVRTASPLEEPSTSDALAEALSARRSVALDLAPEAPKPKPAFHRWRWLAVACLAIAALIVTIKLRALLFGESGPEPSTSNWRIDNLKQITARPFSADRSSLSTDGQYLVYVSSAEDTDGLCDLFVKPTGEGEPIRITNKVDPASDPPVFTADGTHIAFMRDHNGESGDRLPDVFIVPIIGSIEGFPRVYIRDASSPAFSPDGEWVAYTKHLGAGKALWISPVGHLDQRIEAGGAAFATRWSPDGKWVAYTTSDANEGLGFVWIASVLTSEAGMIQPSRRTQLTKEPQRIQGLAWTPDSGSVIFSASHNGPALLWCVSIAGGPPAPLTTGVGDYSCPGVSPDGTLVTAQGRPARDLVVSDTLTGANPRQISHDEYHVWPRLSPSGDLVASVIRRPGFEDHLYVTDLNTRKRTQVTNSAARHPCWMDDRTLAYLRDSPSGQTEAYVVDFLNPAPRPLVRFSGEAHWLAVHPNKRRFAAVLKLPEGGQRVVLRDLDNREKELTIAEGAEYEQLRWLPDGSALSWSGPAQGAGLGSNGIWKWLDRPGSQPARIVGDGYGPVWSSDGANLYFSKIGSNAGLYRFDLSRETLERIRAWRNVRFHDIAAGRLVYIQDSSNSQIYSMSLRKE